MNKKREDRLKIHIPVDESESEPDEEETPEQRGIGSHFMKNIEIRTNSNRDCSLRFSFEIVWNFQKS